MTLDFYVIYYFKKFKWIKNLNVSNKNFMFLWENIGNLGKSLGNFYDWDEKGFYK